MTDAVQRALEHHQRAVRTAVPPLEQPAPTPAKRGGPVAQREVQPRLPERRKAATLARRRALYDQIVALHTRGVSKQAIRR